MTHFGIICPATTGHLNPMSTLGAQLQRRGHRVTLLDRIVQPVVEVIAEYRRLWNLPAYNSPNDFYSPLAQICQQPAAFEFPRQNLPEHIHFTGPYCSSSTRQSVAFPFEQLSGKPLVYASLGTLHNRLLRPQSQPSFSSSSRFKSRSRFHNFNPQAGHEQKGKRPALAEFLGECSEALMAKVLQRIKRIMLMLTCSPLTKRHTSLERRDRTAASLVL